MDGSSAEFRDVFFDGSLLRQCLEFDYGRAYGVNGGEDFLEVVDEVIKGPKGYQILSHSLFKVIGGPGLGNSFFHMREGKDDSFVVVVIDLLVNKDIGHDRVQLPLYSAGVPILSSVGFVLVAAEPPAGFTDIPDMVNDG